MSTRTLPSERDRKMTILLTPFMSCTAKLPIYGFFVSAFFPGSAWWIITLLYLLGIVFGILTALVFRKTLFQGEAVPFVMELPNYRLPSPRNVLQLLWEKARDFLQRAFSIILIATLVVWLLGHCNFRLNLVDNPHDSIMAALAGLLTPLFRPIGLGDWRIITSLVSGFMAKESVVASLETLFPEGIASALTSLTAVGMLVFSLLYTPCVAAVASIRRELGRKWSLAVVLGQCALAWLAALAVRLLGMLFGL
jgi:ferrous iron transport protein B